MFLFYMWFLPLHQGQGESFPLWYNLEEIAGSTLDICDYDLFMLCAIYPKTSRIA